MDYSEVIIKEYDEMADRRVATVCRINIAFMVIVGLLNILGIFIIDMKMLIIAYYIVNSNISGSYQIIYIWPGYT